MREFTRITHFYQLNKKIRFNFSIEIDKSQIFLGFDILIVSEEFSEGYLAHMPMKFTVELLYNFAAFLHNFYKKWV